MSRSISRPGVLVALVATVALASGGCRNPFNPSADIELAQLISNNNNGANGNDVIIYPSELGSSTLPTQNWIVTASFVIKNKVAATITSVNIQYTDLDGNPVTTYRATGGKSYKTTLLIHPMTDDNNAGDFSYSGGFGEGAPGSMAIYLVDRNVTNEISAPGYPGNGFMFAIVTFRGQDDNGYDFVLSGKIGIKYY